MSLRLPWLSRTRLYLLAAGGLLVLIFVWHRLPGTARANAAESKAPSAIAVQAAPATRADVPVYIEGLGTAQAYYTVTINSRVDGQLQKVAFVEGQTMKKGDLLAQIDPRPYAAALGQVSATEAKDAAQLLNAKNDLQRYILLAPHDLASKQTLDTQRALVAQLEAQVKGDQAAIDSARTQLDYTRITAPIDGRTGIRLVDPGNNVHATDTTGIVVMTQVQPISVIFTLPEEAIPAINRALAAGEVTVAAESRDDKTELGRGTVSLIDNQIDQTTGTIRVKAAFPNKANELWPGLFVNARVLLRTEPNALTIPVAALERGPDGEFAYVVGPGSKVEVRALKIGEQNDSIAVVESGLKPGEQVVISNQYRLEPGIRVRIAAATDDQTAAAKAAAR